MGEVLILNPGEREWSGKGVLVTLVSGFSAYAMFLYYGSAEGALDAVVDYYETEFSRKIAAGEGVGPIVGWNLFKSFTDEYRQEKCSDGDHQNDAELYEVVCDAYDLVTLGNAGLPCNSEEFRLSDWSRDLYRSLVKDGWTVVPVEGSIR